MAAIAAQNELSGKLHVQMDAAEVTDPNLCNLYHLCLSLCYGTSGLLYCAGVWHWSCC